LVLRKWIARGQFALPENGSVSRMESEAHSIIRSSGHEVPSSAILSF
jgi:hypothetical protein